MVEIAFRQPGIDIFSTWISWGINPTSIGMIDAQAFVAYTRNDANLIAYTSPISSYRTSLKEGALSFPVYDVSAMYENNSITIFATLQLPRETIMVDIVWQKGQMYGNNVPKIHSLLRHELRSYGTLNFLSGNVKQGRGGKLVVLKSFHGIMCSISWGVMLPVGVLIARYSKVFKTTDPIWFKLHVTCQSSGYIIGLIGWATGLNVSAQLSGLSESAWPPLSFVIIFKEHNLESSPIVDLFKPKKLVGSKTSLTISSLEEIGMQSDLRLQYLENQIALATVQLKKRWLLVSMLSPQRT
nr:cytochrome b561 and DOMON domain-containing protein At5g47530-like [Quercus suber]